MSATLRYSIYRTLLFVVPFAILMVIGFPWYLALLVSVVVAFCVSYIFLRTQREATVEEIAAIRSGRRRTAADTDDDAEDAALDASETATTDEPAADANPDEVSDTDADAGPAANPDRS